MKPKLFKGFNATLGAPPNWDKFQHGECKGLPVRQEKTTYTSYWKPSLLERIKLLFGADIEVCVVTIAHPPIALNAAYKKTLKL